MVVLCVLDVKSVAEIVLGRVDAVRRDDGSRQKSVRVQRGLVFRRLVNATRLQRGFDPRFEQFREIQNVKHHW